MLVEVRRAQLVGDEFVGGLRVGHPQQRFGKAHQRYALVVVQAELAQEGVQHGGPLRRSAHLTHQLRSPFDD